LEITTHNSIRNSLFSLTLGKVFRYYIFLNLILIYYKIRKIEFYHIKNKNDQFKFINIDRNDNKNYFEKTYDYILEIYYVYYSII